jgi:hypothetical protein
MLCTTLACNHSNNAWHDEDCNASHHPQHQAMNCYMFEDVQLTGSASDAAPASQQQMRLSHAVRRRYN